MLFKLWRNDDGEDIAEYAVMLAILLLITVVVIKTIGINAQQLMSEAASQLHAAM